MWRALWSLFVLSLLACGGSSVKSEPRAVPDGGPQADGASGGASTAEAGAGTRDGGASDGGGSGGGMLDAGDAGDAGAQPDPADARLFRPLTSIPRIDFTLTAAAEQSLRKTPRTYVQATFSLTDSLGSVGPMQVAIRQKGAAGSALSFDEKMAFKLDFNAINAKQELFGLKKLNLNNMVQDPSCVREWVSYQLFASEGVPAPRTGYVRVFVNGSLFGVYLAVEASDDKGFLKRNFPSTRVLYEGEYGEDLFEGVEPEFDEDAGDDPERLALRGVTHALATAPADEAYTKLASLVDWPEILAELATEIFIGHWDGYARSRNNYFLHFDAQQRMSILPWGTDNTFEDELPFFVTHGLLFERCFDDLSCRAAYVTALGKSADSGRAFVSAHAADLKRLASILSSELATDTRFPFDEAEIPALADSVLDFVTKRANDVDAFRACLGQPNVDTDGDGYACGEDCREGDALSHPRATEICGDALDQDCNGLLDDGRCPACAEDDSLGTRYLFCREPATYEEAELECTGRAGSLVKLGSTAQAGELGARAHAYFGAEAWWLGLTDRAEEGTFRWADGSSAGAAHGPTDIHECGPTQTGNAFCDFEVREPNDFGGEDCVTVSDGGSDWNDKSCLLYQAFVCALP